METKAILVIAAHPDDEVLGCAATIALRVKNGASAHLLTLTGGLGGRKSDQALANEISTTETQELQKQMKSAADLVGYSSVTALNFPDNRMDTVSRMDVSHSILEVLKKVRPDVIYTHHPGDYNWDHTIVFDAVMMAARSSPGEFAPKEILCFEVLSSTERSWQHPSRVFCPNVYVNVAATIEIKKKALELYRTEYRNYPHPRSSEGQEFLARKRGNEVGIEYAEAFHLIRRVEI